MENSVAFNKGKNIYQNILVNQVQGKKIYDNILDTFTII